MNIFTVDLEDWYHANYHPFSIIAPPSRVVNPTLKLLELLKKTNSHATFFILGKVAERHPDLIQEICHQGHEIANHSFAHKLVYTLTANQFEKDLEKSTKLIYKITGVRPIGYRAPSWSVSRLATPWFWKILKNHHYSYSSSLFPFKTFLYGDSTAPTTPHQIDNILEIPPTVDTILFRYRIPFSGGFYLRLLPLPIIKYLSKRTNPTMYYIHPREIDTYQPRLPNLTPTETFIHYFNIQGTYRKLESLLKIPTQSIQQYL